MIEDRKRVMLNAIRDVQRGVMKMADFSELCTKQHQEVFELAYPKSGDQAAFDFFNLTAQLAEASAFENPDHRFLELGRRIITDHLGDMYSSSEWTELTALGGPATELSLYLCSACGHEFPVFVLSGFMDLVNMYCAECGHVLFVNKYDQRFLKYFDIEEEKGGDPYERFCADLSACACGGRFNVAFGYTQFDGPDEERCPMCSSTDLSKRQESRFKYFSKHSYSYFDESPNQSLHGTP